jgi:hypothetical protein
LRNGGIEKDADAGMICTVLSTGYDEPTVNDGSDESGSAGKIDEMFDIGGRS